MTVQLYLGDCLDFMRILPAGSVDFVYADPPYGVGKADWDERYFTGWETDALRISKHGVFCNCGVKALPVCMNAFGEDFRDLFYGWNKNGMTRSSIGFMNVIIGLLAGRNIKLGQNFTQFVIRDLTRKDHPSPKPIEYICRVIERFTDIGDLVFDPFMGSGTTGVACVKTGRNFIGCEIDPNYFAIADKRIKTAQQQPRLEGI